MAAIVDTNILVYRYDPRDLRKQRIVIELLRRGLDEQSIRIPYQAIVEFYAVVTRRGRNGVPLLDNAVATRETDEILVDFEVLYPTEEIIRAALYAIVAHQLSLWDALIWAYAEVNGLTRCAALSTAITPTSSYGPSVSIAAHVPRLAKSIFVRPPPTGAAILPERSSATTIASDNLRCSFLISIDTGKYGSSADLK